jgi:hypothetical protein
MERGWPFYLEASGERLALLPGSKGERGWPFYMEVSGKMLAFLPGSE